MAVISSELVEQETSDITVPENGECTLVVISMPDLKANYENLYKVLLANSDVDVRAPGGSCCAPGSRMQTPDEASRSTTCRLRSPALDYQDGRAFDLYLSLVGELFDLLRDAPEDARDWATLGNALSQAARALDGSARRDATFFSAAAFYSGGYSASAYVAMRQEPGDSWRVDT